MGQGLPQRHRVDVRRLNRETGVVGRWGVSTIVLEEENGGLTWDKDTREEVGGADQEIGFGGATEEYCRGN